MTGAPFYLCLPMSGTSADSIGARSWTLLLSAMGGRGGRECSFSIEGSRSGAASDPAVALPFPGSTMEHPGAAFGESVPSARDACALIRRPRRSIVGRNEPKTLDGAAQLVHAHVGVAPHGVHPTANRS